MTAERLPPWAGHMVRRADADPQPGSLRCDLCRERAASLRLVPVQELDRRVIRFACGACGGRFESEPLRSEEIH